MSKQLIECSECSHKYKRVIMHRNTLCRHCGRCRRAVGKNCSCRGGPLHGSDNIKTTESLQQELKQQWINAVSRAFSVEIECATENGLYNHRFDKFKHTLAREASVPTQQEMVIGGLVADDGVAALVELATAMDYYKATVDKSCGYHVHVDVRDLTAWQLYVLTEMYLRLEEWLFRVLPPHRAQSKYCMKLGAHPRLEDYRLYLGTGTPSSHNIKTALMMLLTGQKLNSGHSDYSKAMRDRLLQQLGSKPANRAADPQHARYYALNLHSVYYRGSVEFRMFPGTTDVVELITWPMFVLDMVEATGRVNIGKLQCIQGRELEWLKENVLREITYKGLVYTLDKYKAEAEAEAAAEAAKKKSAKKVVAREPVVDNRRRLADRLEEIDRLVAVARGNANPFVNAEIRWNEDPPAVLQWNPGPIDWNMIARDHEAMRAANEFLRVEEHREEEEE